MIIIHFLTNNIIYLLTIGLKLLAFSLEQYMQHIMWAKVQGYFWYDISDIFYFYTFKFITNYNYLIELKPK